MVLAATLSSYPLTAADLPALDARSEAVLRVTTIGLRIVLDPDDGDRGGDGVRAAKGSRLMPQAPVETPLAFSRLLPGLDPDFIARFMASPSQTQAVRGLQAALGALT